MQAVIFDMDGVLTDSEPIINAAAIAMFRELGQRVQPEDFTPFIGAGEDRYIGGVAEKYGIDRDIADMKKRTYEIYLDILPGRLQPFPGARDLVHSLRDHGLKVAVASSADWIKVEANLQAISLPPVSFDAVITAEKVEHKKPAPDIFLAAAAELDVASAECVVVEDAVNGVEAALAAGMGCLAVAQSFPAERLAKAHLVKPTIGDIRLEDLQQCHRANQTA